MQRGPLLRHPDERPSCVHENNEAEPGINPLAPDSFFLLMKKIADDLKNIDIWAFNFQVTLIFMTLNQQDSALYILNMLFSEIYFTSFS